MGAVANLAMHHALNAQRLGGDACRLVCATLGHGIDKGELQVVLQALRALVALAKPSQVNQEAMVAAKACQLVCRAVERYKDQRAVVMYAARLLEHLASESVEHAHAALEAGGARLVADMLRRLAAEDREAAMQACRTLLALSWDRHQHLQTKQPILHAGLCEILAEALARHASDAELLALVVEATASVAAGSHVAQDRLRECGALKLLVQAMGRFPGHVSFQDECLRAMSSLCHHNAASQTALAESCAARAACDALRRFGSERQVVLHGMRAVYNLAHHCRSNQDQLRAENAAALIADALRAHVGDKAVATEACRAAANLTWRHAEAQEAVRRAGVCGLLCEAARTHPDDRGVRVQSCRAMTGLAHRNPDCQAELARAGACELLVEALCSFPAEDREVTQEAVEALCHLSLRDARSQECLSSASVCHRLLAFLQPDAVLSARDRALATLDAMANMAREVGKVQAAVRAAGGAQAIVRVLQSSSEEADKDVQLACLRLIACLGLGHQRSQADLAEHGGMAAVSSVLAAHPEDRLVQVEGLEAVLAMVSLHHPGRRDLIPSTALQAACRALSRFASDDRLALQACLLLSLCPYSPQDQELVGGAYHACPSLTAALTAFAHDRAIVSLALADVAALSQGHHANQDRLAQACGPVIKAMAAFPHDREVQM